MTFGKVDAITCCNNENEVSKSKKPNAFEEPCAFPIAATLPSSRKECWLFVGVVGHRAKLLAHLTFFQPVLMCALVNSSLASFSQTSSKAEVQYENCGFGCAASLISMLGDLDQVVVRWRTESC